MTRRYNEEEVREILGLKDPDYYRLWVIHQNTNADRRLKLGSKNVARELERCTGRTTNILVKAMVELSKGKSVIVSASTAGREAHMFDVAVMFATKLGLDEKMIYRSRNSHHLAQDHED